MFVILAPRCRHSDLSQCGFGSWSQRGWCRLELWCKMLSATRAAGSIALPEICLYELTYVVGSFENLQNPEPLAFILRSSRAAPEST